MLAGTCGEGLWLRDRDREALTRAAVDAAQGRLLIALQVTDNSALRVLDHIDRAVAWGADLAVVADPPFYPDATPEQILIYFRNVVRRSALPIGFYDRGSGGPNTISESLLPELLAEPNIVVVKDSSAMESRRAIYIQARETRAELVLLNGNEFDCVRYLRAGYDGLLLGGGIFNARMAREIIAAVRMGDLGEAERINQRMKDLMQRVYGGPKTECWLAGLKELLVRMGVFSTRVEILGYPLTAQCRAQIAAAVDGTDGLGYQMDLFGRTPAVP
jgi:4-hydroxy-tetrahydrodipicolinate synthase